MYITKNILLILYQILIDKNSTLINKITIYLYYVYKFK